MFLQKKLQSLGAALALTIITNNMAEKISYASQHILGEGTNADIDTNEEDIVSVTVQHLLKNSQLTIYIDTTLGTHTSMEYRFYYQNEASGTWYAIPKQNISTDLVEEYMAEVNSSTPGAFVIEFGLGSCFGFKITGKGVGGANGAATIKILGRDN